MQNSEEAEDLLTQALNINAIRPAWQEVTWLL